jgi:predicted ribosome quality control (RQC) complex YloA/Tae2 family protein
LVGQWGAPAGLFLLGDGDRILAVSSVHPDPGGWKVGSVYTPKALPEEASPQPPRLVPVPGARFPWAEAAEALYEGREGEQRAQELRRQLLAPLKRRLARLARTLEKVTIEAARGPQAEEHRRSGELITRNLDRLERGMKTARLIEYGERGAREVEVSLQPDRTPKQQAEWHFHQYRRFSRGSERAAARLKELGLEAEAIHREIEQLERLSPEKILAKKDTPSGVRREAQRPKSSGRSRPYKEYFTVDRQPIWVGRDARGNESLTFHLAQPNDLWLHARGGSGSHVVVPLDRKADVPAQLLVDAAHLALHHSSFKGEPRGEVAYTRAKYVRRQKGGAAGSVILTREKTFVVRIDQARLARLLDSRTDR